MGSAYPSDAVEAPASTAGGAAFPPDAVESSVMATPEQKVAASKRSAMERLRTIPFGLTRQKVEASIPMVAGLALGPAGEALGTAAASALGVGETAADII